MKRAAPSVSVMLREVVSASNWTRATGSQTRFVTSSEIMENFDQQIFYLVSVAVIFVVYGTVKLVQWRRRRTSEKSAERDAAKLNVTQQKDEPAGQDDEPEWMETGPHDESDFLFGRLTPLLAAMMPVSIEKRERLTRSLRNAGYYSPHAWQNFGAVWYLILLLPIFGCGALLAIVPEELEATVLVVMIIGTALAWALPSLWIQNRARDRLRQISTGMPDMLDLLNMCVSQGMTVTGSFHRVGRDLKSVYPALAKEMEIVSEQARIGMLSQALTNFAHRVDLPEVLSFSNLLTQTEKLGTSVSQALADYSEGMRQTLRQRADEKANSAAFKLLFPTVLCLMPAVYLFLLGPSVVELGQFFDRGATDALRTEIPSRFIEQ
ncbi:Bacterial type II secretion system protein F domain protein [Thalassoglobus neptunius]|uniref:Bacterial type II secretion system protein F domain protein n=1 Tax=Thalassoglobus neptunius TaxID=1938619 RepID=A0A5C5WH22_9PLAN|nr:type II secretion system F family protein [Thalassoglobus neptunius]TWT49847.1 Bacterial type II secretion system protein F domain protein [Thalassoglobus neptunius]